MSLQVHSLSKSFGAKRAVQDLSFTVEQGQVFGLLGLNGAGKSTTIRMILNILEPDAGEILWQGRPAKESIQRHFGYLPEERGLYQKMKVIDHLVLFTRLQGMSRTQATAASDQWLQRFEITQYRDKQVSELSKGNQQKIQFIAAVLHQPQMLILDEPFSGLDPVNTSLFKDVFREIATQGRTIIFSSHQLDNVEELSDAVGIIHNSRLVLNGEVREILNQQPPQQIRLRANPEDVQRCLGESATFTLQRDYLLVPIDQCQPAELLQRMVAAGIELSHYELVRPTLNDVFLQKVGKPA